MSPLAENVLVVGMGLIFGSFCNVLIARLPSEGKMHGSIAGRSRCPHCDHQISAYDNIPVLSYLLLAGKCRHCKKPIALRYPVVELLFALLLLAYRIRFGFTPTLWIRDLPWVLILVTITFIDFEHRIIPDVLSIGGAVFGLILSPIVPSLTVLESIGGAALGFSLFYGLAWAYEARSGRTGLGGGDIKLMATIGAFLGPAGVITTMLVASLAGSVVGLIMGGLSKLKGEPVSGAGEGGLLKVSIPFGPFLALGALYYDLLGDWVWLPFTDLI